MKKVVSLILALALCAALSVTALAAEPVVPSEQHDVSAHTVNEVTFPNVFSVDIQWGEMQFTYTKTGAMVWNKDTHQYEDNTVGTWTAQGNTVSVTNHSNKPVTADLTYTQKTGFEAVQGTLDKASFFLPSAVGKTVDDASLTETAALTLDGVLDNSVTDFTAVGTVTVTISEADYA